MLHTKKEKAKYWAEVIIGNNSSIIIQNVLFVEGLKHSLLSINYLHDK